ncbi:hypothetical protein BT69DRAFT_1281796 [Atractiella rhizophila]|nr:hypothetical protein BT69DRAFT_1281796 [Atractiella rhizophila]
MATKQTSTKQSDPSSYASTSVGLQNAKRSTRAETSLNGAQITEIGKETEARGGGGCVGLKPSEVKVHERSQGRPGESQNR